MSRRAVITGRAVVSPVGVGFDDHWRALLGGRSAVTALPHLAALGLGASRGAAVSAESIKPHLGRLPRKQQKLYNRPTLLAMLAASFAMDDAGLSAGAGEPERFGVLLGVNPVMWSAEAMTRYLAEARDDGSSAALDMARANRFCMHSINPLDFSLKTLPNLTAGHIAIAHEARGLCRSVTEGAIGGAHAVGQAFRMVQEGELDVVLCGGADAQIEEFLYAMSQGTGLLAADDGGPGMIPSEGSGLLVVEDAERAEARGARVHGEVLGFAMAAGDAELGRDGDTERLAARLGFVIDAVMAEARSYPDAVTLNADGLPRHDAAELLALERVLGPRAGRLPLLRLKPLHGHLGAATAPVEVAATLAAIQEGRVPAGETSVELPSGDDRRALVISIAIFGECAALMVGRPC